jgi:hypothetical protein
MTERTWQPQDSLPETRYVVIGAGAAGVTLATGADPGGKDSHDST